MKKFLKITSILVFFFYLPLSSMAWGILGHRIVGQIADSYLNPKARAAIQAILGNESMAMASNWADFIKSDTSYRYLNAWHYADFPVGLNYTSFKDELKK